MIQVYWNEWSHPSSGQEHRTSILIRRHLPGIFDFSLSLSIWLHFRFPLILLCVYIKELRSALLDGVIFLAQKGIVRAVNWFFHSYVNRDHSYSNINNCITASCISRIRSSPIQVFMTFITSGRMWGFPIWIQDWNAALVIVRIALIRLWFVTSSANNRLFHSL